MERAQQGTVMDRGLERFLVDRDQFDGSTSGQARRAQRCGASGKLRNAPGGPICPTEGRVLFQPKTSLPAPCDGPPSKAKTGA